MKLHHFALFFVVIAVSFFISAQIELLIKRQESAVKRTEYDCLVAAVNSAVDVAFCGIENEVTENSLLQAEEVFFQTLAVLHEGSTDSVVWKSWREKIPCIAVLGETGYYLYGRNSEDDFGWSELKVCDDGKIPKTFYEETAKILMKYQGGQHSIGRRYRMEDAQKGIWEQGICIPCVFAVYAPEVYFETEDAVPFLYAASGRRIEAYYVTEDNRCHISSCEMCRMENITARYATQKESAQDGAFPCEICLK